jgi:hypothetical protein
MGFYYVILVFCNNTWNWFLLGSYTYLCNFQNIRCWWDVNGWPLLQEVQIWHSNVETQVKTCQNVSSLLCLFSLTLEIQGCACSNEHPIPPVNWIVLLTGTPGSQERTWLYSGTTEISAPFHSVDFYSFLPLIWSLTGAAHHPVILLIGKWRRLGLRYRKRRAIYLHKIRL